MGRKIAVIGSCCAGKTTLAVRLADELGIPHIELDALHHGPNWQEASADELRTKVEEALAGLDGWVVDGNYMGKLGTSVIDRADTIVWLDLPLRTLLPRIWRRTHTRRRDRVQLWHAGNYETWRGWWVLTTYTIRTHHHRKRCWPPRLEDRTVVRLHTPAQTETWLANVRA